jgi:hypothetical protein
MCGAFLLYIRHCSVLQKPINNVLLYVQVLDGGSMSELYLGIRVLCMHKCMCRAFLNRYFRYQAVQCVL